MNQKLDIEFEHFINLQKFKGETRIIITEALEELLKEGMDLESAKGFVRETLTEVLNELKLDGELVYQG